MSYNTELQLFRAIKETILERKTERSVYNIKLTVPTQKNQLNQVEFSTSKRKKRKRIETLISQLNGQFAMNINFAKTLKGLNTRILSKTTALTFIQYFNLLVFNRSINNIKTNLLSMNKGFNQYFKKIAMEDQAVTRAKNSSVYRNSDRK